MGNLFTININYNSGQSPWVPHTVGIPPFLEHLTQSVTGSDPNTGDDLLGPLSGVFLQYYNNISSTNAGYQWGKDKLLLNYANVQTINYSTISRYTQQFSQKSIKAQIANSQGVTVPTNSVLSRQVQAQYTTVGRLQRIQFGDIDRDRILWNLRCKDPDTNEYIYWTSETINSSLPKSNSPKESKEVLGSYVQIGIGNIDKYGKNYEATIDYNVDPPQIISVDQHTAEPDDEIGILPSKQTHLIKLTIKDRRNVKKFWDKRGFDSNINKYVYWKDQGITSVSTTYNTIVDSDEILSSHYELEE